MTINDPADVERLLRTPGVWAVVGLSTNNARPAHGVARFLQSLGHRIVPVHPRAEDVHGARGYPRLDAVPGHIDVVDLFVNSGRVGPIIDEAIALGAGAIWLQIGVRDAEAEQRARDAGLTVVVDTCPRIEARRLPDQDG